MKYKVGEKVRIAHCRYGFKRRYEGRVVTIRTLNPNGLPDPHYGIIADDIPYIFFENELEPVNDQKVVITVNGKETHARLYDGEKVIKSAIAKCSPDDTFDFATGAKLAFERLMPEEKASKFKVGDKVVGNKKANDEYTITVKGWEGYVIEILDDNKIRVAMNADDKHGFGVDPECFDKVGEKAPESKREFKVGDWVEITNGMFNVGKTGQVIEDDGTNSAPFKVKLENGETCWKFGNYLKKIDPPKYLNGKVVCIKSGYPWWTVGKVYDVVDGIIKTDKGRAYPKKDCEPYRDFEDVRHAGNDGTGDYRHNVKNEFIPFKE